MLLPVPPFHRLLLLSAAGETILLPPLPNVLVMLHVFALVAKVPIEAFPHF